MCSPPGKPIPHRCSRCCRRQPTQAFSGAAQTDRLGIPSPSSLELLRRLADPLLCDARLLLSLRLWSIRVAPVTRMKSGVWLGRLIGGAGRGSCSAAMKLTSVICLGRSRSFTTRVSNLSDFFVLAADAGAANTTSTSDWGGSDLRPPAAIAQIQTKPSTSSTTAFWHLPVPTLAILASATRWVRNEAELLILVNSKAAIWRLVALAHRNQAKPA
ncbi:hypothetical protein ACVIN2_002483 [Bradyrhizobium sp. USDA 3650]